MNERKNWQIIHDNREARTESQDVVDILLKNRGLETKKAKEEFMKPTHPEEISLADLEIDPREINKAKRRIKKAISDEERIIVYGDYDADGICATGVFWEALHAAKADALPYIPERFSEGYGLNGESLKKLKREQNNLGLVITVDNGIVAHEAIKEAKKLGIDVIITDHHQKEKDVPSAVAVIHTTKISGSAVAWVAAREIFGNTSGLDLVAIGTIADVLPLLEANRSFAFHGIRALNNTERPGLLALLKEANVRGGVDSYTIGFIIAPRINSMGRLADAMDSLRLICTIDASRAKDLAMKLGRTNQERQKVVEEVVVHANEAAASREWSGVIMLGHESYHEGVIGLAAAKLVERYYRPAIVLSKGEVYSKASARSIQGFNMIEALQEVSDLWEAGGGHPMAAGFTIRTEKINEFAKRIDEIAALRLTDEVLSRKLNIDMLLNFDALSLSLAREISCFEPYGLGNYSPTFASQGVEVLETTTVGKERNHLKMVLRQGGKVLDAIAFGFGEYLLKLSKGDRIDIAYGVEENVWNGKTNLQLKIKDIRIQR